MSWFVRSKAILPALLLGATVFADLQAQTAAPAPAQAAAPRRMLAEENPEIGSLNKPERMEWFRDQGFGLFIHWSVDSQLGVTISHSLVGASEDYVNRFYTELPKTFDPENFRPDEWARLAKIAGVQYVVFTTKHHSGFVMFDTKTTPFNIMNTPFRRDVTAEVFKAFRAQGIATGVYFSPDDFNWLHTHGKTIERLVPEVQPSANPGLLTYDSTQVRELLTKYGNIDMIYFDGEAKDLRALAWKLQPNIVVTRGAIQTPEQRLLSVPPKGPWEASLTMSEAWQYQPQNDVHKSGKQIIELIVQSRSRGGNVLLDVGPKPDGSIPIEQEARLREIGAWMFVNGEAIYGVRPWVITNEGDLWFTRKGTTLYVVVDSADEWRFGTWKDFTIHSVRATDKTEVSVLGQSDQILEYHPAVVPKTTFQMEKDGLHIRANHAQRMQDNYRWPNPVVLKITNVEAALTPPQVKTVGSSRDAASQQATLRGELLDMGGSASLDVGFEYRAVGNDDVNVRTAAWIATPFQTVTKAGVFSTNIPAPPDGARYEFRAVVRHPLLSLYGGDMRMRNQ
jgi:alpha-L-fucosidase